MAGKHKSKKTSSRPVSGRPSPEEASTESARKAETSSVEKRPRAVDPGPVKLHSPVGPLMWLLIPFVLCILIALAKNSRLF
jgi:hypothetical protein